MPVMHEATMEVMSESVKPAFPVTKATWVFFFIAALFPFYSFIQMNCLNTLGAQLIENESILSSQLGFLSALYIYTSAALYLPVGILLDRFPTKNLLATGVGFCTIGAFFFAISQEYHFILTARFISGIGHAFAFLSCFRLVAQLFSPQKQACMIGWVVTFALLGGAFAQTPLVFLSEKFHWKYLLWSNVLLGFILMIIIAYVLPSTSVLNHKEKFNSKNLRNALFYSIKSTQNWITASYICLMGVPIMVLGAVWGTLYVSETKSISFLDASWVSFAIFWGTIIGSPIVGWISDRIHQRKLPMILGAIFSSLLILIFINISNLHSFFYIGLFFALTIFSATQIIGYSVVMESNPKSIQGTAMGLVNILAMGGLATAQILFGWLWEHQWLKDYIGIFLFITLSSCIFLACLIREKNNEQK
jgi:predicted MFS family arabinose efflux permease